MSVLGGGIRPSRALPKVVLAIAIGALLVGGVGCGEGEAPAAGAAVAAYVEAPLCAGAKRELAKAGPGAGSVEVRAICLDEVRRRGRLDLAAVGANARRASEDSAAIAYLEAPITPSFSRPIVEAAGIAVIRADSGAAAMARLLVAVRNAGSGSLRDAVREALGS
ncbi:MAG: hypothetical protein JWM24_1260 [Solirubrobacterales bacterium]|nr:hypothetical protein [Solirubrobacterales bacterium]